MKIKSSFLIYRLTLEYDGTDFFGWQFQPNRRTAQGELERALKRLFGRRVPTVAAARTDAGTHAQGQVVSFQTPRLFSGDLAAALNRLLPRDMAVLAAEQAKPGFHSQKDALAKTYRYCLINRPARPALQHRQAGWIRPLLSAPAMRREARRLLGRRDFSSFSGPASRGLSPVCHIRSIVIRKSGDLLTIDITADRFLHHMARRLVGRLVQAGLKKDFKPALTLEAKGLTLLRVFYK